MPVLPYLAPSRPNPLVELGKRVTVSKEKSDRWLGVCSRLSRAGWGILVMPITVGEGVHGVVSYQSLNQRSENIQDRCLYCEIGFFLRRLEIIRHYMIHPWECKEQ